MDYVPVTSSNLQAVAYDPDTLTLGIRFLNGSEYQYSGVPPQIHQGLMAAGSKGTFFDTYIKKGNYQYRRVS
jgi:hypothetical protein